MSQETSVSEGDIASDASIRGLLGLKGKPKIVVSGKSRTGYALDRIGLRASKEDARSPIALANMLANGLMYLSSSPMESYTAPLTFTNAPLQETTSLEIDIKDKKNYIAHTARVLTYLQKPESALDEDDRLATAIPVIPGLAVRIVRLVDDTKAPSTDLFTRVDKKSGSVVARPFRLKIGDFRKGGNVRTFDNMLAPQDRMRELVDGGGSAGIVFPKEPSTTVDSMTTLQQGGLILLILGQERLEWVCFIDFDPLQGRTYAPRHSSPSVVLAATTPPASPRDAPPPRPSSPFGPPVSSAASNVSRGGGQSPTTSSTVLQEATNATPFGKFLNIIGGKGRDRMDQLSRSVLLDKYPHWEVMSNELASSLVAGVTHNSILLSSLANLTYNPTYMAIFMALNNAISQASEQLQQSFAEGKPFGYAQRVNHSPAQLVPQLQRELGIVLFLTGSMVRDFAVRLARKLSASMGAAVMQLPSKLGVDSIGDFSSTFFDGTESKADAISSVLGLTSPLTSITKMALGDAVWNSYLLYVTRANVLPEESSSSVAPLTFAKILRTSIINGLMGYTKEAPRDEKPKMILLSHVMIFALYSMAAQHVRLGGASVRAANSMLAASVKMAAVTAEEDFSAFNRLYLRLLDEVKLQ